MRRLQVFNFDKSAYERPNQKWICGRACRGEPCLAGPDQHGHCQATAECRPLRKGDRWYCTRPSALGGPCATSPLPDGQCARPQTQCQPVRSLRNWRGLTVLLAAAGTASALLLVLASKRGQTIVSPGELSFHHSSAKSQCSDCHVAAKAQAETGGWLGGTATASDRLANSRLCLRCHEFGPDSFAPHALAPHHLDELTQQPGRTNRRDARPLRLQVSSTLWGNPKDRAPGLDCAICHFEHRGKKSDLTRRSDEQCQSCHAAAFASFTRGHPEFKDYPFRRRTRIIFDHRSHFQVHFREDPLSRLAPDSCSVCHTPDPKGSAMIVKSFEQTCAACHLEQIRGKGRADSTGIGVIRLPGVDVETLVRHGVFIGDWPEGAEGKLTAFMELLLQGPSEATASARPLAGVDMQDLSKASEATLKQAADLAWSIKELFYDLSAKGQAGLEARLKAALKSELSTSQSEGITALLSAEVIQAASDKWFPHLAVEMAWRRSRSSAAPLAATNSPAATEQPAQGVVRPEDWVTRGGWYRSDLEYAIFYRPKGHADSFLQSWLDLTVATPGPRALFNSLSGTKAPGFCTKCHSVDALPRPQVNWMPYQPDASEHLFTRFSHAAHFSLLDDRGCQTCHPLDVGAPAGSYAASFTPGQGEPNHFRSNFKSVSLPLCASCHTQKNAGEGCLQCHNYHIGKFRPTLPRQQWHL